MIKALIINKGMHLYDVIYDNETYLLSINFIGVDIDFKEADIFLDKSLLIDKSKLNIGPLRKDYTSLKEEDLIKIITPDNSYYLCRYYG